MQIATYLTPLCDTTVHAAAVAVGVSHIGALHARSIGYQGHGPLANSMACSTQSRCPSLQAPNSLPAAARRR